MEKLIEDFLCWCSEHLFITFTGVIVITYLLSSYLANI